MERKKGKENHSLYPNASKSKRTVRQKEASPFILLDNKWGDKNTENWRTTQLKASGGTTE